MHNHHWIMDPVIFSLGPLQVRWYGLMYVVGFIITGFLLKILVKDGILKIDPKKIDSLITMEIIAMFLGARTAYVFIYNWDYYSQHLGEILAVWQGGLSFHGAVAGLFLGAMLFARQNKIPFLQVTDSLVTAGSQGVFFGRLGNFINGELFGRKTDVAWAMVFPGGGPFKRHPSQLYEAFLEGLILFLILWFVRKKVKNYGVLTGMFFSIYGVFRYFIEFFREADAQLGYYFGGTTTMGQILCLLQICFGLGLIYYSVKKQLPVNQSAA
jgi:phosphatidylglycerol:prolipoprotein diacylglycerol transferase